MFEKLKQTLFFTPSTPTSYHIGFFILRFIAGLALCTIFEKVFPRNGVWGPQDWFIQDVSSMGFPFPVFFAWLAVLTEFVGGILLILGLFTRPAAFLNVIVTFVAAFLYHKGDIVQSGLTAFVFMTMCLCITFFGAGKYSLDYLFYKKIKKMNSVLIIALLTIGGVLNAQPVSSHEISNIEGTWKGDLTYTDYKDDISQTKLNCDLEVKWKNKKGIFTFTFTEPNGQTFKDKTKIKLTKRGSQLKFDGKYDIIEFNKNEDNTNWEMIVRRNGKDNNRNAELKLNISLTPHQLIITKNVKYEDSKDFFIRNRYTFEKQDE